MPVAVCRVTVQKWRKLTQGPLICRHFRRFRGPKCHDVIVTLLIFNYHAPRHLLLRKCMMVQGYSNSPPVALCRKLAEMAHF